MTTIAEIEERNAARLAPCAPAEALVKILVELVEYPCQIIAACERWNELTGAQVSVSRNELFLLLAEAGNRPLLEAHLLELLR